MTSRPAAPESCGHDDRFKDVFNLPQEDNGCLACALERTARALSLVQTEIKGHMRVKDELRGDLAEAIMRWSIYFDEFTEIDAKLTEAQARIAELEKELDTLRGKYGSA